MRCVEDHGEPSDESDEAVDQTHKAMQKSDAN